MKAFDQAKSLLDKLSPRELSELKVLIVAKQLTISSEDKEKAVSNLAKVED